MIYICIPSYNEAPTVGLLLWKVRQVFAEFPREYQLVVADDASTDNTPEVLESYTRVLPLTVLRNEPRQGSAASVEQLLRDVVARTDRPKRDFVVVLHADFAHDARAIPDLVRRLESGADIAVAQSRMEGESSFGLRLVRRLASQVLRPAVAVPGIHDIVSGFAAFRLVTLRNAFRAQPSPLLTTDGWVANAELIGQAARYARRVEGVPAAERHDLRQRPTRANAWERFGDLMRARRQLRVPSSTLSEPAAPQPEMAAS